MISAGLADTSSTDPTASDRELLQAHVAGSASAFAELVSRHSGRLWAVALRIVGDPEDAADVLQDALVKAFRSAGSFRGDAAVSTWLHRIVVNTAFDLRRRPLRTVTAHPGHDAIPDPPDPRDRIADLHTALDVHAALATLPIEQRTALVLVDLSGFSVDEAAEVLQCPVGTVKSRCFRGRRHLAGLLADYAPGRSSPASTGPSQEGNPQAVPGVQESREGATAPDEEASA